MVLSIDNAGATASTAFIGTPTINGQPLNPALVPVTASFPYLRRALARVRNGAGDAKLLLLGDSTVYGAYVANGLGAALTLAKRAAASDLVTALGLVVPTANTGTGSDSRWTAGTGWVTAPTSTSAPLPYGWGGESNLTTPTAAAYFADNASGSLVFTPGEGYTYDTFDIYYLTKSSLGSVTATPTGSSGTVISAGTGSGGVGKTTVTAGSASTSNAVTFSSNSGYFIIIGVEPSLSTTSTLRIANAGVSGATTTSWTDAGSTAGQGPLNAIEKYAPDVALCMLGINDAGADLSVSSYLANLLSIGLAVQQSGDFFVASPVPSESSGTYLTQEAAYAGALPAFCEEYGFGFIDVFDQWDGANAYTLLNPLGYYYNNLHPSLQGYADLAAIYAKALVA